VTLRRIALALLACVLAAGCGGPRDGTGREGTATSRAFFFWRTRLELSAAERAALETLGVRRLFVRFFDVEWSARAAAPTPVAILDVPDRAALPRGVEVIPVVFVRADVFERTSPGDLAGLAERVWQQVRGEAASAGVAVRELQLDCDWTEGTREAYFGFLEHLRRLAKGAGASLSATIRLHQVKYRERTGVPPVERGMLMFYNVAPITASGEVPAIFDVASAARYTARLRDYPLPLDAALPIWAWAVHARGSEVVGLMQAVEPTALDRIAWLRPVGAGRFVATRTAFLHGELLREGDILRVEAAGEEEARTAAGMLADSLAPADRSRGGRTIALFDLSERNLRRHGDANLERLFSSIR
jgi:hypothetical protein